MSRFPKLTETFILNEMLAVEQEGVDIDIYPLQRERAALMHTEAPRWVARAQFQPWLSWNILRSHWHVVCRRPGAYLAALATLLWANLGSLRFFAGAIVFFPKAVHFACRMQATGVNHVHAHFASHPAAAAFVIHRLTGIPFSFTAHGSDLHRDRHMLAQKVAEAAFVVTISDFNRDLIVAECGEAYRDKIAVIHCGVDTAAFTPAHRSASASGRPGRLQILCIGTLHEVKGQLHLVEACRRLDAQGVSLDCHFVGEGPDRVRLERQATTAGLADRVHFHGAKSRCEIIDLLRQADIVAAPSVPTRSGRREGIPVVLMEAMASGVPVVASRVSGIPELVEDGETGLLVPPGDAAAVAAAIARLAADDAFRGRLARAAREKVEREFDLHQNACLLAQCIRAAEAA